jgi:hypothetical protein
LIERLRRRIACGAYVRRWQKKGKTTGKKKKKKKKKRDEVTGGEEQGAMKGSGG